ncbi:MAG: TIGR01459 family HAD-type hydrolase [Rhodobacteraceae bacterium]|jgi:HAD superfamily hydrolase (TIGR01459 family)|nr:TIGR01459 family HAD-type hydrolase [Paracoccaceae bacterium]MBL4556291.1 TIGR01459 family HAD-type hydrolase [Paracoccaceae bacterium]HBG97708.1 TIGR01459 family HAD-type hydrolase [Paracoccaceae bacterium]
MTRIIDRLADIAAGYDALLCDVWGVVHNGVEAHAEAVAALAAYRAGGGKVILMTNSPRPRTAVIAQIDALGVARDAWDDVASSGDAAQAGMLSGLVGRRVYHIGAASDEAFFSDIEADLESLGEVRRVPLEEAEGIVCTGLRNDETETPDDYRTTLLRAKTAGLKLLCANPDIRVERGDKIVWCAGALASLYAGMGGESLYFGKPHAPIYNLARNRLERVAGAPVPHERILMIGDGLGTDIAGAMGEDLDSLFVTGGLDKAETGTLPGQGPDPEMLTALLQENRIEATFAIGQLR